MIIGIDLRVLAKKEEGGISQYLENLLPYLIDLGKDDTFKLFYNGWKKQPLNYLWLQKPNVKLYEFKIPNHLLDILKIKIDKLLKGIDVFFSPHFLISNLSEGIKKIITVHDISFYYWPEFFDIKRRLWHWRINPKKQINSADKIIAVSQSTKKDLIEVYGTEDSKISVIYSGIDEKFKPLPKNDEKLLNVKNKYNLPDKFILYFGKLEPRKNLIGLIQAFEELNKNFSVIDLVIAGEPGWLYKDLKKALMKSKFKDKIYLTGRIPEEDKIFIYNLAEIFVYPSFFEGFGFPPLEAMACGVPVITSNQTSLPEIVSTAAVMINPLKVDEMVEAMLLILNNPDLRNYYSKAGIENAKKFNWEKTAIQTLNLIKGR